MCLLGDLTEETARLNLPALLYFREQELLWFNLKPEYMMFPSLHRRQVFRRVSLKNFPAFTIYMDPGSAYVFLTVSGTSSHAFFKSAQAQCINSKWIV